jgi:hypothetical protein
LVLRVFALPWNEQLLSSQELMEGNVKPASTVNGVGV